jgi:hypothetical protein
MTYLPDPEPRSILLESEVVMKFFASKGVVLTWNESPSWNYYERQNECGIILINLIATEAYELTAESKTSHNVYICV